MRPPAAYPALALAAPAGEHSVVAGQWLVSGCSAVTNPNLGCSAVNNRYTKPAIQMEDSTGLLQWSPAAAPWVQ